MAVEQAAEGSLEESLAQVVLGNLRPLFGAVAVIYLIFIAAVLATEVVPERLVVPIAAVNLLLASIMGALWYLLREEKISARHANALGAATGAVLVLDSILKIRILDSPYHTLYVAIVIVGAGCFLLSTRWLLVLIVGAVLSWAAVVQPYTPGREFAYYALSMFASAVLSLAVHRAQRASYTRVWLLQLSDARHRERRELEREIREQHDFLRSAINALSHPFYVIEADTFRVLLANEAAREAVSTGNFSCYAMSYGRQRPCSEGGFECPVELVTERREAVVVEHSLPLPDGGERVLRVHGYPVFDEDGELRRVIEYSIDVTRERRVQEQARTQERLAAVGQLAAGIAHDFNNILQMIQMYSELIRQSPSISSDELEQVNAIIRQARRAAHLVRQILDFSRKSVRGGRPLDLARVAGETVQLLRRTIREQVQLSLDIEDATRDYVVRADTPQLQQVITNLVLNAQDAMPDGGRVSVRLAYLTADRLPEQLAASGAEGEWIELCVHDTGQGIPPQLMGRLFEPFFTTKGPQRGTGLGLAQVYGIVTQHGGHVGVDSRLGEGSSFRIWLPRVKAEVEASDSGSMPVVKRGRGELVLVVEDEAPLLEIVSQALRSLGFEVVTAGDAGTALARGDALRDRVDLVLSDVMMPGCSGPELVAQLRPLCPRARFVLMSGYPLEEHVATVGDIGKVGWLQKPFSVCSLMEAVNAALQDVGDA